MKSGSVTTYVSQSVEDICDAYGKGFDQCKRGLANSYPVGSDQWHAYEYGLVKGKEEDERQFKETVNVPF